MFSLMSDVAIGSNGSLADYGTLIKFGSFRLDVTIAPLDSFLHAVAIAYLGSFRLLVAIS